MKRADRLSVFVLIDAFGWELAQKLGFLADALPHRTPLRTVLGYSSGAIPTILTGKPPAQHGHWNLFYYDPDGSPFRWLRGLTFLPEVVLDNRVSRRALKEVGRRLLGLGPLFECCVQPTLLPLFNYIERDNIYEPRGIRGAPSIFDELTAGGIPYRAYTYHRYRDADVIRGAKQDIEAGAAGFYFLYLCEVDSFLHAHCEDSGRVERHLAAYESSLRELLAVCRRVDPGASFTVFSDHGMTPIRHHHDLAGELSSLALRMPDDYVAVYDSTMARYWFFTEPARRAVTTRLSALQCGRILNEPEIQALGLDFGHRRYGDLVFLMNPGWLVTSSDFNPPHHLPAGMHGYHPDDPYSDAVFLSTHEAPVPLRTIADLHGCLRAAAGLNGAPRPLRVAAGSLVKEAM